MARPPHSGIRPDTIHSSPKAPHVLLGKNTYKTSFLFVKRQEYNQKVVLFIVFV